jgi:hypothetical protein
MADGKAIDRATARGGIDGGLNRLRHAQFISGNGASSKRKVPPRQINPDFPDSLHKSMLLTYSGVRNPVLEPRKGLTALAELILIGQQN